jgi:hypothetical protein
MGCYKTGCNEKGAFEEGPFFVFLLFCLNATGISSEKGRLIAGLSWLRHFAFCNQQAALMVQSFD